MKKFLFLALILIASCEEINDSESTIKFFKCLLLDSDVTYNYINSLVDAVEKNDPVKLAAVFSTIYPAIGTEAVKCKAKSNGEQEVKAVEKVKEDKIDILALILKLVKQYVVPFLKKLGIELGPICKMVFPKSQICELFN